MFHTEFRNDKILVPVLNTQHQKAWIKSKWSNLGKRVRPLT